MQKKLVLIKIFIVSVLLVPSSLFGQVDESIKPKKALKMAKYAHSKYDPYSAIDYMQIYLDEFPENYDAQFLMGVWCMEIRDYTKAEYWFNKAKEGEWDKETNKIPLYHALMLMQTRQWKDAPEELKKFKKAYKNSNDKKVLRKVADNAIKGCALALQLRDTTPTAEVTNLGNKVNKPNTEFAPTLLSEDELIFAALREEEILKTSPGTTIEELPAAKMYLAKKNGESWKTAGELDGPFNGEDAAGTGNGAFSPDGNRFYFTRCKNDDEGAMQCKIYWSKKSGNGWSEPMKMPKVINHRKYTSTQPAIGTDPKKNAEILYFVSDRPGGQGGLDIWYSVFNKRDSAFTEVKNAGRKVNTVLDETSPFYDQETLTMYFSSAGHPGAGGLDVFKSTGKMKSWTPAINMGMRINSEADDLYFSINKERTGGFVVSNRKGGMALKHETCCDDIYEWKWFEPKFYGVTGTVATAENPDDYLEDAVVTLYLLTEDGEEVAVKVDTLGKGEKYLFSLADEQDYSVYVSRKGYLMQYVNVSTKGLDASDTMSRNVQLDPISADKAVIIKNIYYEFAKHKLTESSKEIIEDKLVPLMNDNPQIIVEIGSHTDHIGSDSYNLRLSDRRAESVVNYLVEKGIDKDRLRFKGYGEEQPIANNLNEDGSDNEEGRARNRRTEFKIIGEIEDGIQVIYRE